MAGKRFGLIGYPLKNSFSENYFNSKFIQLGLKDYTYKNYPIENLCDLKNFLIQSSLNGFNITIPYKETIIPFIDILDASAEKVGAVNCVKISTEGKLIGYNTDVFGFEQSLLPFIAHHKVNHALILGTGGAAKAVAYVLHKLNIGYRYVGRSKQIHQFVYEDLSDELLNNNQLIINCTPLGMFPNIDAAPNIPYPFITAQHLVYDLIYLPTETKFLLQCKRQHATTKNGLEMLHLQAEKSWDIWMK